MGHQSTSKAFKQSTGGIGNEPRRKNKNKRRNGYSHVDNLVSHANYLFINKDYEGALKYLQKHGAKHIDSSSLQLIIGKVHNKLNHPKRALLAFSKAHDANPNHPSVIRHYVAELQESGDMKAEDILYRACQLDGGFNANNLVMLGNLYKAWGEKYPESDYNEFALVCYRQASEYVNFKGEPEHLYNSLYDILGRHPNTKEMEAIEKRMALIDIQKIEASAYCAYHR